MVANKDGIDLTFEQNEDGTYNAEVEITGSKSEVEKIAADIQEMMKSIGVTGTVSFKRIGPVQPRMGEYYKEELVDKDETKETK